MICTYLRPLSGRAPLAFIAAVAFIAAQALSAGAAAQLPYEVVQVRQLGTPDYQTISAVLAGSNGQIYVSGDGNSSLGPEGYQGGSSDGLLGRYDAGDSLTWVHQVGGSGDDVGRGLAEDSAGNVLMTGYTSGSVSPGVHLGSYDGFLRKYDAAGNLLWGKQVGTTDLDLAFSVAADAADNAYVVGYTYGFLGPNGVQGAGDAFVAKFDAAGASVWNRQLGSPRFEGAANVAVDPSGNVIISGSTEGSLGPGGTAGSYDAFIAQYHADGSLAWVRQWGTAAPESLYGLAVDSAGAAYVSGTTQGNLGLGGNQGGRDAFVSKFDAAGNLLWTRQIGSTANEEGAGVTLDQAGNVFLAGITWGSLGPDPNAGGADAFLSMLNAAGDVIWTQQAGTSGDEYTQSVAVDGQGRVLLAGLTFGSFAPGSTGAQGDGFVLTFAPVPEPSGLALSIFAAAGLAAAVYRMRRRAPSV